MSDDDCNCPICLDGGECGGSRLPAEQAAGGTGEAVKIAEAFWFALHRRDVQSEAGWRSNAPQWIDAMRAALAASPSEPLAGTGEDNLVGGEGPAVPRSQYEAALKGSGCIEIYDPTIDDFRLYDVTRPEGIGAVVAELTGRMFRAAVEANLRAASAPPETDGGEDTETRFIRERAAVESVMIQTASPNGERIPPEMVAFIRICSDRLAGRAARPSPGARTPTGRDEITRELP